MSLYPGVTVLLIAKLPLMSSPAKSDSYLFRKSCFPLASIASEALPIPALIAGVNAPIKAPMPTSPPLKAEVTAPIPPAPKISARFPWIPVAASRSIPEGVVDMGLKSGPARLLRRSVLPIAASSAPGRNCPAKAPATLPQSPLEALCAIVKGMV